jgi:Fic family protein
LFAGTFRNTPVSIGGSGHTPVEPFMVAEEVAQLCEYVNENWERSALHLAAYVLWRLNWIHPFADGNGRTARTVSYIVLSAKLDSLLPGSPTIPDQISVDKTPYYSALESADTSWKSKNDVDVSQLENMLGAMLAKQLVNAANQASKGSSI